MEPVQCGCGLHTVEAINQETIFWRGGWWEMRCAVRVYKPLVGELAGRVRTLQEKLEKRKKVAAKLVSLKRRLRKMRCGNCNNRVGRGGTFHGNMLMCLGCTHDNGGSE